MRSKTGLYSHECLSDFDRNGQRIASFFFFRTGLLYSICSGVLFTVLGRYCTCWICRRLLLPLLLLLLLKIKVVWATGRSREGSSRDFCVNSSPPTGHNSWVCWLPSHPRTRWTRCECIHFKFLSPTCALWGWYTKGCERAGDFD